MKMKSRKFMVVYADNMVEPLSGRRYTSRAWAQRAADRLEKQHAAYGTKYAVYSLEEYAKAVEGKGEWKTSPFTGRKVWVALGTPACCDPTTETYMSM
jgi:hypothetical protein